MFILWYSHATAQTDNDIVLPDSIANATGEDKFEQMMFKAISQRGVENKKVRHVVEL